MKRVQNRAGTGDDPASEQVGDVKIERRFNLRRVLIEELDADADR